MQEGLEKGMQEGLEKGMQEGMEKGMQEGIKEGIKEGMKQSNIQNARGMKAEGIPLEIIAKITGLPLDEIFLFRYSPKEQKPKVQIDIFGKMFGMILPLDSRKQGFRRKLLSKWHLNAAKNAYGFIGLHTQLRQSTHTGT